MASSSSLKSSLTPSRRTSHGETVNCFQSNDIFIIPPPVRRQHDGYQRVDEVTAKTVSRGTVNGSPGWVPFRLRTTTPLIVTELPFASLSTTQEDVISTPSSNGTVFLTFTGTTVRTGRPTNEVGCWDVAVFSTSQPNGYLPSTLPE